MRVSVLVLILMIFAGSCKNKNVHEQIAAPINKTKPDTAVSRAARVENGEPVIKVTKPEINQPIGSPLQIKGKAMGSWFFEGSAPVKLVNENNKEIVKGVITTTEDWTTKDFVNFSGKLSFDLPENSKSGFLILAKSNPSGLAERNESIKIPVRFSSEE
ncbi:MAG: Gmad2 immunoglobulin-like domain-containing protein [Gillisia sp.]